MEVESYITAMSEIARVFCAIHMRNNYNIVYPDSSTKPLKYDVNRRHPKIDEILTNGGFTLKYNTYVPPTEFATLKGEIKAHLSPNERDAEAYNREIKRNCKGIEEAIVRDLKETNIARRKIKGEKTKGVVGELKGVACESLYFTTPKGYRVEEIMLSNHFKFAELFNDLCGDYHLQGSLMTYLEAHQKSKLSEPKVETEPESRESQQEFSINRIIAHNDTEKAKAIIRTIMQNTKGKSACVAILALKKANIISYNNLYRTDIFKILSNFLDVYIGTDSSINKYWNDSTIEGDILVNSKKITQLISES